MQVLAVIAISIVLSMLAIAFYILTVGGDKIPQQVFRRGLTMLLCFFLYQGQGWARWVMTGLFALGSVYGLVTAFTLFALGIAFGAIVMLVMSILYLGCGLTLLLSSSVAAFLAYQRMSYVRA